MEILWCWDDELDVDDAEYDRIVGASLHAGDSARLFPYLENPGGTRRYLTREQLDDIQGGN